MNEIIIESMKLAGVSSLLLLDKLVMLQFQLHRPIVSCSILGLMTGEPVWGCSIGALWELIWAREEPLGTKIPPDESAAALVNYSTAYILYKKFAMPFDIAFLVFFAVFPLGYFFSYADALMRNVHNRIADFIEQRAKTNKNIYRLHLIGIVNYFIIYLLFIAAFNMLIIFSMKSLMSGIVFSTVYLHDLRMVVLIIAVGVIVSRFLGKFHPPKVSP